MCLYIAAHNIVLPNDAVKALVGELILPLYQSVKDDGFITGSSDSKIKLIHQHVPDLVYKSPGAR